MSAVLFLSGETMGDALGSAGRSIRINFERLSYQFVEINLAKPDAGDLLSETIKNTPIEFVFTFVGMGAEFGGKRGDGKEMNLWEAIGVPFLSCYGDSPAYFFDRHVLPGNLFASLYAYPEHLELRKRLPHARGLLGVAPHALLDPTAKSAIDFAKKAQGKLRFLKNGNSPEQLRTVWREALSERMFLMIADLAAELASEIQTDLSNDIDRLVCSYFRNEGLDVENLTKLRLFFIAQLDDYVRRLKSTLITEALLDFPIEVHGFNWEHVNFSGRRATLIPTADYTKSKALIKESLGIIDMSPNTGLAPHDRPMRAFGMYTLCLTNDQAYFKQNFEQCDGFSFQFEKESIQAKIADVISHPHRYVELGMQVAEQFRKNYEPDRFARFMLDIAASLRLNSTARFSNLQNFFVWPPEKLS